MKKHILFAAGPMLAAVLMTGCGSKPAETTAAATAAETESTAAETTQAAGSEAESSEAEVSADNPFAGKTVRLAVPQPLFRLSPSRWQQTEARTMLA